MRAFKLSIYFAIGLFFGGAFTFALAETIPATSSTYDALYNPWKNNVGMTQYTGSSPSTACEAFRSAYFGANSSLQGVTQVNDLKFTCNFLFNGTPNNSTFVYSTRTCNAGDSLNSITNTCSSVLSCPINQNWILQGSNCTRPDCAAGQTRNTTTGQCETPCPAAGTKSDSNDYSGDGAAPTYITKNGCRISCSTTVSMGNQWASTGCKYNGDKSTGTPTEDTGDPLPPEEKKEPTTPGGCLASGQGYVTSSSGSTSCVKGSDAPPDKPVKSTDTTSTTDASGNKTSTKTETTCDGGTCTEKTTETAPDGTTKETSKEQSSDNFCQQNPTSPMCKEQGDPCKDNPNKVACAEFGEVQQGAELEKKELGPNSISPVSLGGNASCPAGIPLPKGMGNFSFQPYCDYASALRPIFIAMAWLSVGFLIFGMRD